MKKEEQQNNKGDEKISFFEGAEETVGFFDRVKNFFQNGDIVNNANSRMNQDLKTTQTEFEIAGAPIKISDGKKTSTLKKEADNIVSQKEIVVAKKSGNGLIESHDEKKNSSNKKAKDNERWLAPNILSTNLIKGETTVVYHWGKQIVILLTNVFFVFIVIGVIYGGLLYWEKQGKIANAELDARAEVLKKDIQAMKKDVAEINRFNEKILIAKKLLDKHIYWENFFLFMEKNILKDVYLSNSFSGGIDGNYVFKAYTKDLKTMLDQVNYLRRSDGNDEILSAGLANISVGDTVLDTDANKSVDPRFKVSFDLILEINKEFFLKK